MEETATTEAPDPAAPPATAAPADTFVLDENSLASLSPEQRASLDPIIDTWRKKATETISKRETEITQKYKPLEEKAQAMDKLAAYQPFVQWWQQQQNNAKTGATAAQREAIAETKPADIATPQEWQEAIWEASNGNSQKLSDLQSRMFSTWATPMVQKLREEQAVLRTEMAVKDLFDRHEDARDLDLIGIDQKTREGVSLLEMGLDWAERNGRTLEEGYQLAKSWAGSLESKAQQKAMGLVTDKKNGVTAGPSTATTTGPRVVQVANADELIKQTMEAQLSGDKDVRFVIRGK